MKRLLTYCFAIGLFANCGHSSPAAPTPTPTGPTAAATYTLSGQVTSAAGPAISGASVAILDGPNAGKATSTDSGGAFSLANLVSSGFTVQINAGGFTSATKPVSLTQNVTLNVSLLPAQVFSQNGTGDMVFEIPRYVTRIRVQADYGGNSSNFIVHVAGRTLVNELLGTGWGVTHFDGTYVTTGGTTEITNSSGVAWSFVEVR